MGKDVEIFKANNNACIFGQTTKGIEFGVEIPEDRLDKDGAASYE